MSSKPRIAHLAGSNATIANSPPLVTSNKARQKYGLPVIEDQRFDALRPQRLAAPVTIYVQQFSAHPLERDAVELYGPPDGYLDASSAFHRARQANGQPWEEDCAHPGAPVHLARQSFYPDASRIFEEIDRLGIGNDGLGN